MRRTPGLLGGGRRHPDLRTGTRQGEQGASAVRGGQGVRVVEQCLVEQQGHPASSCVARLPAPAGPGVASSRSMTGMPSRTG